MDAERARTIAEWVHAHDREADGTPLLAHIRRVARRAPVEARAVAWLHEALAWTAISEQQLLTDGLTSDELRALRLLTHMFTPRSDDAYLEHLRLVASAAGPSGGLARSVKLADLEDRRRHPHPRHDGWWPPYARAVHQLRAAANGTRVRGQAAANSLAKN